MFRSKIKDEDWGVDTLTVWYIALTDLGMTQDEFNQAKRKSLSLSWPPTAPADFLELARAGKQSEYLDTQTAFETACRCAGMRGDVERDWRHPTVLETANRIGWGKLASADNRFLSYFKPVYEKVLAEHRAGASFVVKEERRLERPKPVNIDEHEQLSETWAQIKARFGVKKGASNT